MYKSPHRGSQASPHSSLSEAEPGCFGSRIAFDEESDLLPDKSAASRHQPRGRERDVAGGLQHPLPSGYLTDKNHQLLSKHSASMAAGGVPRDGACVGGLSILACIWSSVVYILHLSFRADKE